MAKGLCITQQFRINSRASCYKFFLDPRLLSAGLGTMPYVRQYMLYVKFLVILDDGSRLMVLAGWVRTSLGCVRNLCRLCSLLVLLFGWQDVASPNTVSNLLELAMYFNRGLQYLHCDVTLSLGQFSSHVLLLSQCSA